MKLTCCSREAYENVARMANFLPLAAGHAPIRNANAYMKQHGIVAKRRE